MRVLLLVSCLALAANGQDWSDLESAIAGNSDFAEVAVVIGDTSGRLFEYTKGGATFSKRYFSASSIKWVTSVVLLRLVEEGSLSLDDTPSMYLGYWETADGRANITLRQLLSFTSGFRGDPFGPPSESPACVLLPGITIDACTQLIHNSWFYDEPGTTYYYGPAHFNIAVSMAQSATGEAWADIFDTRVADVLGMDSTIYDSPSTTNPRVAGGANVTADDMANFMKAMLERDTSFLSQNLWDEMLTDQTPSGLVNILSSPISDSGVEYHYGFGVWRECQFATWQPSCDPLTIASTIGSTGIMGWVDYDQGYYGLIVTDNGLGSSGTSLDFVIDTIRPLALTAMNPSTSSPTTSPPSKGIRGSFVSVSGVLSVVAAYVFLA